jgi:hypothetical protein
MLIIAVKRSPLPVHEIKQNRLGFRLDVRHPAVVTRGAHRLDHPVERRLHEDDVPRLDAVGFLLDPSLERLPDRVRLAARSRVGARSEEQVRRALGALEAEGWRLRHSIRLPGGGDIDHVAIAPTGIAFAIETKTRTYHPSHLAKIIEQTAWLSRHRRRWCPHGAFPVRPPPIRRTSGSSA